MFWFGTKAKLPNNTTTGGFEDRTNCNNENDAGAKRIANHMMLQGQRLVYMCSYGKYT